MKPSTTIWYVKPLTDNTNEQITTLLASQGISKAESEVASIVVDGETIRDVYLVEYWIITKLEQSDLHHKNFRSYCKVGNGKIKLWRYQGSNRKKLARTKSVKKARKQLKTLKNGD